MPMTNDELLAMVSENLKKWAIRGAGVQGVFKDHWEKTPEGADQAKKDLAAAIDSILASTGDAPPALPGKELELVDGFAPCPHCAAKFGEGLGIQVVDERGVGGIKAGTQLFCIPCLWTSKVFRTKQEAQHWHNTRDGVEPKKETLKVNHKTNMISGVKV
jgi:hypothetical protein